MGTKVNSNYEDLLTFTRASEGHALRPVSYGDELVTNGTLDSDTSGWVILNDSDGGWNSGKVEFGREVGNIDSSLQQTVTVEAGKVYQISFDIASTTGGRLELRDAGIQLKILATTSSGSFQTLYTANDTSLFLGFFSRTEGDLIAIDNISVKEVLFDQPDGTLTLFEHPENVPRVEYDADGNRLGLLIEEQRTNNITNSESCSFVDKSGGTVTASTTPAPYGTSSTVKRIQSSTLNGGGRLQVTILTGGDNYCSVYVRSRTGADQNLKITAAGTTGATQVAPASGDWVRLGRVASLGAGSRDMRVLSTGDTIDLDIALPQVELGSFPTSYIKTTGSTASRSADVAKIEVDQFGYNQSEGTLVVEWKQSIGAASYVAMLSDGTAANRSFVRQFANGSAYYSTITNNVAQGDVLTGTVVDNQSNKIGVVYKYNDAAGVLNGASAVTDATSLVPEGVSTLSIGSYTVGSSQYINGHIKSIQYYPRRLTNAQLQDLTS